MRSLKLSPRMRVVNSRGGGEAEQSRLPRAGITGIGLRPLEPTSRMDESADPPGSFRPGHDSTPLATSTIQGRTRASRSATFSGVRPPARMRQG